MKKIVFIVLSVVFAGIIFSSCKSNDEKIQKDVQSILVERHPGVTSTVSRGIVTLMGTVESDTERMSAENDIKSVKDIESIVNNIDVRQPQPTVTVNPNDEIRNSINNRLSAAGYNDVNVEVKDDGEVVLSGDLNRSDLTRVMQIANESNPKKVTNNLKLK